MRFNSIRLSGIEEVHAIIYSTDKNYSFQSGCLEERKWEGWSEEKCLNSDLWTNTPGVKALAGFIAARSTTPVEWDLLLISTLRLHIAL
jgi:hypothetical protein